MLLTIVAAAPLVSPGDAPWINDEPLLISQALAANEQGIWARHGLVGGSLGIAYGPVAPWFYQVLLRITHDPVALILLRSAVVSFTTAGSLAWLARSLRLTPWFAAAACASPYFWLASRSLWDNSLLIPLSALTCACYAQFLVSRGAWPLRATVLLLTAMPFVHLMSLPLVAAISMHLLLFGRTELRRQSPSLLVVVLGVLGLTFPYWRNVPRGPSFPRWDAAWWEGWLYPLAGGRLLSATGLDYFFTQSWLNGADANWRVAFRCAVLTSATAFLLTWCGMGVALARLAQRRFRDWTPLDHLSVVALASFSIQTVVDGIAGIGRDPHYYHGTWIVYVLFAWLAVDALRRWRLAAPAAAVLGMALLSAVALLATRIHSQGGTPGLSYGSTIARQVELARQLASLPPDSAVSSDVEQFAAFPHALEVLMSLLKLEPAGSGAVRRVRIVRTPDAGRLLLQDDI
jgi:hypothetical protein